MKLVKKPKIKTNKTTEIKTNQINKTTEIKAIKMNIIKKNLTKLIVCLLLVPAYANANETEALINKLDNCSKLSDDTARLSCFDQLAHTGKVSNAAPVSVIANSTQNIVALEQKSHEQKVDEFSKKHVVLSKEEQQVAEAQELTEFSATISSLRKLVRGEWVITLKNGQKWQQKGTTRIKLKVDDIIIIKKGALGSVYLKKKGTSRNIKVKRIK